MGEQRQEHDGARGGAQPERVERVLGQHPVQRDAVPEWAVGPGLGRRAQGRVPRRLRGHVAARRPEALHHRLLHVGQRLGRRVRVAAAGPVHLRARWRRARRRGRERGAAESHGEGLVMGLGCCLCGLLRDFRLLTSFLPVLGLRYAGIIHVY